MSLNRDWEGGVGRVPDEGGRLLTSDYDAEQRAMESENKHLSCFTKVFTLTQIVGLLSVCLAITWAIEFRGGFSWSSNPKTEFNWHPVLMIIAMIFLYGNGALIYRSFRNEGKRKLKIIHGSIHITTFILTVIGLAAVFDSHNYNVNGDGELTPIPNLYSLHSWVGIVTVALFAFQWLFGLVSFLVPGVRHSLRSWYMPIHRFFGIGIFILAVSAALIGLNEKAIFSLGSSYSLLVSEGIFINLIGICIATFAALVLYLLSKDAYRRRATEDEMLLTDTQMD